MFVSSDSVVQRVETFCGSEAEPLTLTDPQRAVVRDCTDDAYNTIIAALVGRRKLSKAQADAWSLGAKFQRDIAFFWSVKALGFYKPTEPGQANPLDRYNREAELLSDDLPLLNAAGAALADVKGPGFAVIDLDKANDAAGND